MLITNAMVFFDQRSKQVTDFGPALRDVCLRMDRGRLEENVLILEDVSTENLLKTSRDHKKLVIAIETLGECPRLVIDGDAAVLFLDHHPSKAAMDSASISFNTRLQAAGLLGVQLMQHGLDSVRGFGRALVADNQVNALLVFKNGCIDQDGEVCLAALTDVEAHSKRDPRRIRMRQAARIEDSIDTLGGSLALPEIATVRSFVNCMGSLFEGFNEARQSGRLRTMSSEEQLSYARRDVGVIKEWIDGNPVEQRSLDRAYKILAMSEKGHAAIVQQLGPDARLTWPKEVQNCTFVYWAVGGVSDRQEAQLTTRQTSINDEGAFTLPSSSDSRVRISIQLNPALQDSALGLYPLFTLLNRLEGLKPETFWGRLWIGGGPQAGTSLPGSLLLAAGDHVGPMSAALLTRRDQIAA